MWLTCACRADHVPSTHIGDKLQCIAKVCEQADARYTIYGMRWHVEAFGHPTRTVEKLAVGVGVLHKTDRDADACANRNLSRKRVADLQRSDSFESSPLGSDLTRRLQKGCTGPRGDEPTCRPAASHLGWAALCSGVNKGQLITPIAYVASPWAHPLPPARRVDAIWEADRVFVHSCHGAEEQHWHSVPCVRGSNASNTRKSKYRLQEASTSHGCWPARSHHDVHAAPARSLTGWTERD